MAHVFIASDHAGFELKNMLAPYLRELGHIVTDFGALVYDPDDDYPELVLPCAKKVAEEVGSFGVIIGGSGQGEAMAANRVKGVRAAVFYGSRKAAAAIDAEGTQSTDDYDIVRLERRHNNANMISFGARFITADEAKKAIKIFLETPFSGSPRHERRIHEF